MFYLASNPPYRARHRKPRRLGDLAAIGLMCAATVLGAVLLTVVAPHTAGMV